MAGPCPGWARRPLQLLAADVQAGDVGLALGGGALSRVGALELGPLAGPEQPPAGDGLEGVLGQEQRVVLPQPGPFALHVPSVFGIQLGHRRPVELEVAADAVAALQLQVGLHRLLQQCGVVPGGAVVDGRGVGRGRHGPELPVELLAVHVLGLVHLQEQGRRVADHVGRRLRREEELTGAAEAHRVAVLAGGQGVEASLEDPTPQPG